MDREKLYMILNLVLFFIAAALVIYLFLFQIKIFACPTYDSLYYHCNILGGQ